MYFGLSEYNLYNLCKTTECDIIRTATNSRRSMTEKHLMRGGQGNLPDSHVNTRSDRKFNNHHIERISIFFGFIKNSSILIICKMPDTIRF